MRKIKYISIRTKNTVTPYDFYNLFRIILAAPEFVYRIYFLCQEDNNLNFFSPGVFLYMK